MEQFKLDQYDVKATFIREKYGLYRWDFEVSQNGEVVASACDYNSQFPTAKEAVEEFLHDDLGNEEDN